MLFLKTFAFFSFAVMTVIPVSAKSPFKIEQTPDPFFIITENGRPVLRYVGSEILAPGYPEDRRRSTYIHPLYTLDGQVISDDFPKDHPHHRGLSWNWMTVRWDNVTKDLWTLQGIRQRFEKLELAETLADRANLQVRSKWVEDSTGRKIIDEVMNLTVYPSDDKGRTLDIDLTFSAVDTPVAIGASKTGYSGFNLRFAPRKNTTIVTSRGKLAKDSNYTRFAWADLSAQFGAGPEYDGAAIFDHPSNPHFPAGWCLRFYGVLNPSFTCNHTDYTVEPGKPLRLIYRVYVHRGQADELELHRVYRDFEKRK